MPVYEVSCSVHGQREIRCRIADMPVVCDKGCGENLRYVPQRTSLGGGLTLIVDDPFKPGRQSAFSDVQAEAVRRGVDPRKLEVKQLPRASHYDDLRHESAMDYAKEGLTESDVRKIQDEAPR